MKDILFIFKMTQKVILRSIHEYGIGGIKKEK